MCYEWIKNGFKKANRKFQCAPGVIFSIAPDLVSYFIKNIDGDVNKIAEICKFISVFNKLVNNIHLSFL